MAYQKKNYGVLTLIPTPISEYGQLESHAWGILNSACSDFENNLFLVEDLKPARRRWSHWALPRQAFEYFIAFNEHTKNALRAELISKLKKGKNLYLMSDGGLPAFCDPGVGLVDECHQEGIKVTSTPFCHSVALAISLSGMNCEPYLFLGFPPRKSSERADFIKKNLTHSMTTIWMDTPYRLKKLIEEIKELTPKRDVCLCLDLARESEWVYRGEVSKLSNHVKEWKREFILLVSAC